jgi:predicted alpha/beta-hydrolase family hydrolase
VACRTAAALDADAGLLLSFPLHLPGQADRPDRRRDAELALAPNPTWMVQGARDPFGTPEELAPYVPEWAVMLEVDGAHSFPKGARPALVEALTSIVGMLPG